MSEHDEPQSTAKGSKRRRIGRACDMCRLKKIRCDGRQGPGQKCSNCTVYDDECTFVQDAPKRQSRPRGYVQRLETRVAAMEDLLAKLCPSSDVCREMDAMYDANLRLEASDFEDSDSSGDEAEDEAEDEGVIGHIGRGRARKETEDRDRFTYAVPPAFSPSLPLSNPQIRSPDRAGFSRHNADSKSVTPYDMHPLKVSTGEQSLVIHEDELESSEDESEVRQALQQLSLYPQTFSAKRYLGKSSNVAILRKAVEMKYAYASDVRPDSQEFQEPLIQEGLALLHKVRSLAANMKWGGGTCTDASKQRLRHSLCSCPNQCAAHPWTKAVLHSSSSSLTFPEPDLLCKLINLYFQHHNPYIPVLHRPLFVGAIADGLHHRNVDFGSLVLLVCALGARFSDDRRVLLEKDDRNHGARARWVDDEDQTDEDVEDNVKAETDTQDQDVYGWHSAGWKWFNQVELGCRVLATPATLYDLQIACLASIYFRGSSAPEAARNMTGLGLRLAQDLGVHRKKTYSDVPNEEDELLKRTFWCLVWLEWTLSPALGRPCGIQYEDFDVDYPIECDDEYWMTVDPGLAFQQPVGKPSRMAYFNCALRLNQINAFAHRTIYSTNKSKSLLGFMGAQWEQRIVAELDSALNSWLDSVPQFLRWDPKNPDPGFFLQSAGLFALYYSLQITIHRPFIPSPRKPSRIPFPSLAICTSAARSCVHVLDTVYRRSGPADILHQCTLALFHSGIVLMLNMWGVCSPVTQGSLKEMEDIHKVLNILKALEPRLHLAGRLWDMLYELAVVGELPIHPHDNSQQALVRSRKPQEYDTTAIVVGGRHTASLGESPNHGRRRDSVSLLYPVVVPPAPDPATLPLPVRTDELGRIPLHPVYDRDPTGSHNIYDMSPSIFNNQTTVPPVPDTPIETGVPDPTLDSIFTAGRSQISEPLPHLYAPAPIPFPNEPPVLSHFASNPPIQSQPQSQPQTEASTSQTTPLPFYPASDVPQPPMPGQDDDTLAMWSNAPAGFEWDDWGAYINGLPESTGFAFSQPMQDNPHPNNNTAKVFTFYDHPL